MDRKIAAAVAGAWLFCGEGLAQTAPPEFATLEAAYQQLKGREYGNAIEEFRKAALIAPQRADIRKNLGYTYLKIGENELARDAFAAAMALDPADSHVAMEYAYLAFETKRQREARRVFDRLRRAGNATAEQAFQNIDRPLAEGIARWTEVTAQDPANFSAHQELAQLAEQRDELDLAAKHYEAAWRLRPEQRDLLVALGRVERERGRDEQGSAALLAASRAAEPRAAEMARALLPDRYPYVYEFRKALELDPSNKPLRRELAFLLLEMKDKEAAESELKQLLGDPAAESQLDVLHGRAQPALKPRPAEQPAPEPLNAREMGIKSYELGYLNDAVRYFHSALENDPLDFAVMLKLGWTYNLLGQDREALRWFELARKSPDAATSTEAARARANLTPDLRRWRTTVWMLPVYSSRWKAAFGYGQFKAELKLGRIPLRPYASLRLVGDTRGATRPNPAVAPQYLSETALIPALGAATPMWKGLLAWVETGIAVSYLNRQDGAPRTLPDYRGGVAFAKRWGAALAGEANGAFFEHNLDGVYVHRFNRTFLLNTQNRAGYRAAAGPLQLQIGWNVNFNADPQGQSWANFAETGPGLRFRFSWMPAAMNFTADALRGAYTVTEGGVRRPNFTDLRMGLWYAFTR
jgi:Tfp pilus assembly protein PilF